MALLTLLSPFYAIDTTAMQVTQFAIPDLLHPLDDELFI